MTRQISLQVLNPAPMLTYSIFVTLQEALLTYFMQSLMSDALNFSNEEIRCPGTKRLKGVEKSKEDVKDVKNDVSCGLKDCCLHLIRNTPTLPHVIIRLGNSTTELQARFTMAAKAPAPKPLSMFTTATPVAQELSMVSNGARPWKLAP